jgi:hypothetical protein
MALGELSWAVLTGEQGWDEMAFRRWGMLFVRGIDHFRVRERRLITSAAEPTAIPQSAADALPQEDLRAEISAPDIGRPRPSVP